MVDMHGLDTVHGCCFDASAADAGVSDVALTTLTSTTSHVHFGDAHSSSSWHCISMYVYAQCNLPLDGNAGKLGTLSENVSVNVSVNNLLAISKSDCDNRDNPGQCICFLCAACSFRECNTKFCTAHISDAALCACMHTVLCTEHSDAGT